MIIISTLVTVLSLIFTPASAAEMPKDPPTGIPLEAVITQLDGKPMPDGEKMAPGLTVKAEFTLDGKTYEPGDKITDPKEIDAVRLSLRARKAPGSDGSMEFAVENTDAKCEKCGPATLRLIVESALASRPCLRQPGEKPSQFCTAEEQKQEDDQRMMDQRAYTIVQLMGGLDRKSPPLPSLDLDSAAKTVLENLIRFRYQGAPDIAEQAVALIEGAPLQRELWGKKK